MNTIPSQTSHQMTQDTPNGDPAGLPPLSGLDSLPLLPDVAVAKLDADHYSAADLDGVTDGLFGSGNLNYLMIQGRQTNDVIHSGFAAAPAAEPETLATEGASGGAHFGVPAAQNALNAFSALPGEAGGSGPKEGGAGASGPGNESGLQAFAHDGLSNDAYSSLTEAAVSARAAADTDSRLTGAYHETNGYDGSNGQDGAGGPGGLNGVNGTNGLDGLNGIDVPVDLPGLPLHLDLNGALSDLTHINAGALLNGVPLTGIGIATSLPPTNLGGLPDLLLTDLQTGLDLGNSYDSAPRDTDLHLDSGHSVAGLDLPPMQMDMAWDPLETIIGDIDAGLSLNDSLAPLTDQAPPPHAANPDLMADGSFQVLDHALPNLHMEGILDGLEPLTGDIDSANAASFDLLGHNHQTDNESGDRDMTVYMAPDAPMLDLPEAQAGMPLDRVEATTGDIDFNIGAGADLLRPQLQDGGVADLEGGPRGDASHPYVSLPDYSSQDYLSQNSLSQSFAAPDHFSPAAGTAWPQSVLPDGWHDIGLAHEAGGIDHMLPDPGGAVAEGFGGLMDIHGAAAHQAGFHGGLCG